MNQIALAIPVCVAKTALVERQLNSNEERSLHLSFPLIFRKDVKTKNNGSTFAANLLC